MKEKLLEEVRGLKVVYRRLSYGRLRDQVASKK